MASCFHCGSPIDRSCRFCSQCGAGIPAAGFSANATRSVRQKSLGQIFGLDPRIVLLALIIDSMLFAGEGITLGALWPVSVVVGIVLGFITYKAQRSWYEDDRESAIIKGLIMALLTAIPTSLPGFLAVPSGLAGLIHVARRN